VIILANSDEPGLRVTTGIGSSRDPSPYHKDTKTQRATKKRPKTEGKRNEPIGRVTIATALAGKQARHGRVNPP